MSALIPFDFESNAVRVVEIEGEPWFVAADVCRVLEHSNSRMAMKRWLDDDEKGVTVCYTLGGEQEMSIVSESGLFALILHSRTPAAKRFRKWVTSEVIPSLRKYGSFTLGDDRLVKGRAAYAAAPQKTKDDAEDRVAAVVMYERLVAGGMRKGAAKDEVCLVLGVTSAPLARWIATTRMVAGPDMAAALANKGIGPRGMQAACHPEALAYCADQFRAGVRPSVAYQRTQEEAVRQGWSPIPCEKTMTRNCRKAAGLCAPKAPRRIEQ